MGLLLEFLLEPWGQVPLDVYHVLILHKVFAMAQASRALRDDLVWFTVEVCIVVQVQAGVAPAVYLSDLPLFFERDVLKLDRVVGWTHPI